LPRPNHGRVPYTRYWHIYNVVLEPVVSLCVMRLKQPYAVALIIWIQFTHGYYIVVIMKNNHGFIPSVGITLLNCGGIYIMACFPLFPQHTGLRSVLVMMQKTKSVLSDKQNLRLFLNGRRNLLNNGNRHSSRNPSVI